MLRLNVIAHPGARTERLELLDSAESAPSTSGRGRGVREAYLKVWVRARPVEGQANAAIEHVIAAALGLRPRQVKLVAGTSSRRKIVEIDLPGVEALHSRLVAYGLRAN